jgi:hypothetical protein
MRFRDRERAGGTGVRQDHRELLAAVAMDRVSFAQHFARLAAEPLEHLVAHPVAVTVVDALEVVEVEQHEAERQPVAGGAHQLAPQGLLEGAPIPDTRKSCAPSRSARTAQVTSCACVPVRMMTSVLRHRWRTASSTSKPSFSGMRRSAQDALQQAGPREDETEGPLTRAFRSRSLGSGRPRAFDEPSGATPAAHCITTDNDPTIFWESSAAWTV